MSPASASAPAVPARAVLRRSYGTEELARALERSLAPDNAGYLRARVDGRRLEIEVEAKSVAELQRTLDDALACLSAAERTWRSAHGAPSPPPDEADEERDE